MHRDLEFPADVRRHALDLFVDVPDVGVGPTKIPDCFPGFIDGRAQLGASEVEESGTIVGAVHGCGFNDCGDACAALNDGVMHLPRESAALLQYSFKLGTYLPDAVAIRREDDECDEQHAHCDKPPGAVKVRLLYHFKGSFAEGVGIADLEHLHAEAVLARRKIGIVCTAV